MQGVSAHPFPTLPLHKGQGECPKSEGLHAPCRLVLARMPFRGEKPRSKAFSHSARRESACSVSASSSTSTSTLPCGLRRGFGGDSESGWRGK